MKSINLAAIFMVVQPIALKWIGGTLFQEMQQLKNLMKGPLIWVKDTPEEEIPAQLFVLVKTNNNNIYATNADELITELKKHKDDKVIKFEHYDSIISMIKDDYMHSDICMAELIRSTWLDKVDFEDIAVLLHWAGKEDCLFSFTSMEE